MLSATMFSNATGVRVRKSVVVAVTLFYVFVFFFSFFFPPNFCTFLALDTGPLRVPFIYEDGQRQKFSAGDILTRA